MEPKKVFIYDDTLKPEEKRQCMNYVAELGGVSKLSNTYVSEATHVVVHDTNNLRLITTIYQHKLMLYNHLIMK